MRAVEFGRTLFRCEYCLSDYNFSTRWKAGQRLQEHYGFTVIQDMSGTRSLSVLPIEVRVGPLLETPKDQGSEPGLVPQPEKSAFLGTWGIYLIHMQSP